MGSDGLIELDGECWAALAKYNLVLAALFGVLTISVRAFDVGSTLLLVENGALALGFGAIRTYCWISR